VAGTFATNVPVRFGTVSKEVPQMRTTSNALEELTRALATGTVQIVDLTRTLDADTPVIDMPPPFASSPGVRLETLSRYDELGPAWYWNALTFGEHSGTHFDAPIHWVSGRSLPENTTDTMPTRHFLAPACVIDVRLEVASDADFLLTKHHLMGWEDAHGRIPRGSWFLMHSGWSQRTTREAFLNVQSDAPHTPGLDADAVRFLALEREVLGVGVETVSTDAGQAGQLDPPYPVHSIMHGTGRYGLASLTNLEQLPAVGALLVAAPLKIRDGSGSPLRVFALIPAS
jgi:isatin hydrolase